MGDKSVLRIKPGSMRLHSAIAVWRDEWKREVQEKSVMSDGRKSMADFFFFNRKTVKKALQLQQIFTIFCVQLDNRSLKKMY